MIENNLLTISKFAKMTQISRKNLIYYDSIDLLKPEKYGENGYRYYTLKQVELSYIIIILRSLDMPLSEIKEYLNNRTPKRGLKLFKEQLNLIDSNIMHMHELRKYIQYQLKTTKEGFNVVFDTPSIQNSSQELFFISDFDVTYNTEFSSPLIGAFFDDLLEKGILSNYNIGLIYQGNMPAKGNRTFQLTLRTTIFDERMKQIIKPKGDYLVIYHPGTPEHFDTYIDALIAHAYTCNLDIDTTYYYDYVWDEIVTGSRLDQICKISVMIKGKTT